MSLNVNSSHGSPTASQALLRTETLCVPAVPEIDCVPT